MDNQYCYIEFDFTDERNFEDLKKTFEVIKDSKNNSIERDDQFWIDTFPKYALEKFTFLDSDLKPNFQITKNSDQNWHFYSLIELLSINYEIEYIDLNKTADDKGILIYDAYSYPYGGIGGLIAFVESFDCNPKLYDDGTGIYNYPYEEININSKWSLSSLKKLFKIGAFLLFIMPIICCNNKEKELQFEKEVMYQVYPDLIDSVWVNAVERYTPPPPPPLKDTPEYRIQRKKEYKKEFNEDLAAFKKKHFKVDVVILDKAVAIQKGKDLQEHFKEAVISENNILDTLDYKFDRKKLDSYQAFHLNYVSKIPRGNEIKLYNNCCYSVRGVLILSRIQFDDEKKYGFLTAGINCGDMCGYGYRIYIKKVNDKWVVDKIEEGWIV
jgi:hypothetical protein